MSCPLMHADERNAFHYRDLLVLSALGAALLRFSQRAPESLASVLPATPPLALRPLLTYTLNYPHRGASAFPDGGGGQMSRQTPGNSTGGGEVCRFCFDGESAEAGNLVTPCKCSGSLKYVHLSCLQRWQSQQLLSAASSREMGRLHAQGSANWSTHATYGDTRVVPQ